MDVFLIPTTTSERYELYYEAPDEEVVDAADGNLGGMPGTTGFRTSWAWRYSFGLIGNVIHRMKLRFNEALSEAEEWRHRRHEMQPEPAGIIARWRRKVMGFVVERIAEQRLLWHLRKATEVCARIPTDLTESDADQIIRTMLKKDGDHHRKWLWIDGLLLLASAPLVVIPGPNVPGFYFTFQVVGHYLSWTGAKQGALLSPWTFKPCQELSDGRAAFALSAAQRQRCFHDLAERLRLEHLTTFLEDVAAPPRDILDNVKLGNLAAQLGCRLEGDGEIEVAQVATIEDAGPGDITFLANAKCASALASTRASAVIAHADVASAPCAVLRASNPYLAFARATGLLNPQLRPAPGVHRLALIAADAILDGDVSVGPYAVIESGARIGARTIIHAHVVIGRDAALGPDCLLHARVSIRERVVIGARCVIQDGAVVGSDGFGFAHRDDGTHEKIPQVATVVIEDDVEIGANSTIDRPAVGETRVKAGTKIDNLVQIAHGVIVGTNSLLAAQVGIAGSTIIGNGVMLGGQVGVTGHVTVGDRVKASAKTGVTGNVPADAFITGYPHMENLDWRKAYAVFRRLPEMRKQIAELERRLADCEDKQ